MDLNWDQLVDSVADSVGKAVSSVFLTNSNELFSAFAFFGDYSNEVFAAGLDTLDNSLLYAKRREKSIDGTHKLAMAREGAISFCQRWSEDPSFLRVDDFNYSFSDFKFPGFYNQFPSPWDQDVAISDGSLFFLALAVLDKLEKNGVFSGPRISSPFRLGFFSMGREDLIVVKILNWPKHSGPRV